MRAIFKKTSTTIFISLLMLLISAASFLKQGTDKTLDGKTYQVVIIAEEGSKKQEIPLKDNLIFKAGIFNTSYFMQLEKYPSGVYSTTAEASTGIITFKSQSINKQKDNIAWVGKINGDHVEGTAKIFSKKSKSFVEYSFTGNLKKNNAPVKIIKDTIQTPSDSARVPK